MAGCRDNPFTLNDLNKLNGPGFKQFKLFKFFFWWRAAVDCSGLTGIIQILNYVNKQQFK